MSPLTAYAVKNGSTVALKLDRAAADDYAVRHGGEVIEMVDRREVDKAIRHVVDMGDILSRQCIAMQAAVIDAEVNDAEAGMVWINNTLMGPGLLPDVEAAQALPKANQWGPAQAYFDAEIEKHEDHRQAHPGPSIPPVFELRKPLILKAIGKIAGDGWKDTTKVGEVVLCWNDEMPKPYAAGQFPRVGNLAGWCASTAQYDFTPATVADVRALIDGIVSSRQPGLFPVAETAVPALLPRLMDALQVLDMVDKNNRIDAGETGKAWNGRFVVEEVRRVLDANKADDVAAAAQAEGKPA